MINDIENRIGLLIKNQHQSKINLKDHLLGIINFIESTTGGNQGLNFAIPIDVVSESYSEILEKEKDS